MVRRGWARAAKALLLPGLLGLGLPAWAEAPWPASASYADPTDRYDHNIMGRIPGWGRLEVALAPCATCPVSVRLAMDLPQTRVFEDFAPRLWDITGDGRPEIVTVESDLARGARLAVWEPGADGASIRLLAATAFLGTRHRWLAPIGAADFDLDGRIEIAYVEKPHLAQILRLVRLTGDRLDGIAAMEGVTNHAIGQEQVESLVRTCAGGVQIVALSGGGKEVLAITWDGKALHATGIGAARDHRLPPGLAPCPEP